MRAFLLLLVALALQATSGFLPSPSSFPTPSSTRLAMSMAPGEAEAERAVATATIEGLIKANKIVLFMKGSKLFPQCGFSNTAVSILRACDAEFETFDVLSGAYVGWVGWVGGWVKRDHWCQQ